MSHSLESSLDVLADVTKQEWANQEKEQLDLINASKEFDLAFDEQHSRPQRFTYGAAPFSTCTLMNGEGVIIRMDHVDEKATETTKHTTKAGTQCKSKAKIAHLASFEYIRDHVGMKKNRPKLRYLTCDQASDGRADAEKILRAKFPEYEQCFDLWHKVYPMTKAWKTFVSERLSRKKHDWKYPWLKTVHDADLMSAHSFKSWWVNCSHVCSIDRVYLYHSHLILSILISCRSAKVPLIASRSFGLELRGTM